MPSKKVEAYVLVAFLGVVIVIGTLLVRLSDPTNQADYRLLTKSFFVEDGKLTEYKDFKPHDADMSTYVLQDQRDPIVEMPQGYTKIYIPPYIKAGYDYNKGEVIYPIILEMIGVAKNGESHLLIYDIP